MSGKLSSRVFLCSTFLVSFLCIAPVLQSCSEGPEPFSDFSLHPDVPLEKYAAGRLGIVQPTFARSYLVVAYRYFAGVPLTKDEQFGAQALWIRRIGDANVTDPNAEADRALNPYIEANSRRPREDWLEARKQISALPAPSVEEFKDGPDYFRYVNCSDDALENAVSTLNARAKALGKENSGVQEWLRAQDTVFINCGSPANPAIPDPAPASLPELLRFDREYQIAAAHLYANQYDDAEKAFEKIAAEAKSPWHDIAPYLIARNKIRRASLDVPKPEASKYGLVTIPPFVSELMQGAAGYTKNLLAEKPNRPFAASLQALLDRAEFRLRPMEQTLRLSNSLRNPAPEGRFYFWLCDYTWLLDKRPDSRPGDFYDLRDTDPKAFAEATSQRQSDGLTDWIITLQANNDSATDHALQTWRAHRDSVPWLLAVLAKTNSSAPYSTEVLAAADKIPATSPAYLTAFYHRMRLRNTAKQFADVRKSIDFLLKTPENIPGLAISQLTDLRLDAASDLDDALHFIGRGGCESNNDFGPSSCTYGLGPHSAEVLDSFPLDLLVQASQNSALTDQIKNQIARNIWMRAVLLDRHDVARKSDQQVLPSLGATPPGIKPELVADLLKQYETAATPEEKQFAAVFYLQHQYAFGYEMGTTQPWCASLSGPWHEETTYTTAKPFVPASPAFFLLEQIKQAGAERAILDATDSQANYYAKVVIEFAEKHPDDPRVPESLSRAVKNTDRNCNNSRTSALSKKAFVLLHNNYPNTSWAKNTKYWY
jgi:TolA-binding protein